MGSQSLNSKHTGDRQSGQDSYLYVYHELLAGAPLNIELIGWEWPARSRAFRLNKLGRPKSGQAYAPRPFSEVNNLTLHMCKE